MANMNLSEIELPSNRKFGFFFTAVFFIAAGYFWQKETTTTAYTFAAFSVLFFAIALIKADVLLPLNKLWMRFGLLLGMIVSPIVLGIIFFAMFTPIALLMRLARRDELRLRFKVKDTHWIKRDTSKHSDSFKHQF
jgi:hypothetical protein